MLRVRAPSPALTFLKEATVIKFGILTHGGVGAPASLSDGCKKAAEVGYRILEEGGYALDAVVTSAIALEDDGRFNAGKGAIVRLDGKTIERDASLMDSNGNIGVVINVRNVQNPIALARKVMQTPHLAFAGRGAENLARKFNLYAEEKPSEWAIQRHKNLVQILKEKKLEGFRDEWKAADLKVLWNFDVEYSDVFGCDTIGAVALDKNGNMAVANSTGGASPMLFGRVGDSPIIGCGFYCGKNAAVATTGIGEEIVKKMLALRVHDLIAHGEPVESASSKLVNQYPKTIAIGVISICRRGYSIFANREMASAALISE